MRLFERLKLVLLLRGIVNPSLIMTLCKLLEIALSHMNAHEYNAGIGTPNMIMEEFVLI